MSKLKLSHSAVSRYGQCGFSYKLHYQQKIRPTGTSAALLVGSALDDAINSLLLNQGDPYQTFISKWEYAYINKRRIDIKDSVDVNYAESDFDSDVFTEKSLILLEQYKNNNLPEESETGVLDLFNKIKSIKKNPYKKWTEAEHRYYNYACWLSWAEKARYILDGYKEEVLPRIKNVVAVQKKIEMDNGEGDTIEGFIDLIAEMDDGKTYILDNKSSAREYAEDSPSNKPQLHLYALAEGIENVGFIVYLKKLDKQEVRTCTKCGSIAEGRHKTCNAVVDGKRCGGEWDRTVKPKAKFQVLLGQTNKNLEDLVLENFNEINRAIKAQVFTKNLNACDDWYGGECPYKKLCWHGKSDGLEEVE